MKVYEISFLFLKSLKVDIGQAVLIDKAYHKEDLLTVWKTETSLLKDEKKLSLSLLTYRVCQVLITKISLLKT